MGKTAVQHLLEWLESDTDLPGFNDRYNTIKEKIIELEKQQIIQAYNYGWRLGMALNEYKPEDPEGYYNSNYTEYGTRKGVPGEDSGGRASEIL
jgi:hypothetical protein